MSNLLVSASAALRLPNPDKFGTATFVTPRRAALAGARINDGAVNSTAWDTLLAVYAPGIAPDGPPADPFRVPNVYTDPGGQAAAIVPFRYDGVRAYNYALRYAILSDEDAALDAANQLDAWAHLSGWTHLAGDDTKLAWSYTWPIYLAAASMIDGSDAMTPTLRADLMDVSTRSLAAFGDRTTDTNNHGDWYNLFRMSVAALTGDRAAFDRAVTTWKATLAASIDSNGDLWQEIYRQGGGQGNGATGLHYCTFALMAKTYAAELARANGVWLYDYETPSGHTLRALWERISAWTAAPATYPYNSSGTPSNTPENIGAMEILQSLWPRAEGLATLGVRRPCFDRYGAPYMSVTHPGIPLRG